MTHTCDVCITWLAVHGGAYHKLLSFQDHLKNDGISCTVILSTSRPLGIQIGVDLSEQDIERLKERDVLVTDADTARKLTLKMDAGLHLFDSHKDDRNEAMILELKSKGRKVGQIASLLSDFTPYGADYLFIQHPLTLWYVCKYSHSREASNFAQAKKIYFSGNIFYEPLLNTQTTDVRDWESFSTKYHMDKDKPLCLWLPNRQDATLSVYGEVVSAIRDAGYNPGVKMHPWEYKLAKLGTDVTGLGITSAQKWGITAIEEKDTSWAYKLCELAITRGSSTIFELAFWKKPGLVLPVNTYTKLVAAQSRLVASCSREVNSIENLTHFMTTKMPVKLPDSAYTQVQKSLLPNRNGNSLDWLVQDVIDALSADDNTQPIGSMRRVHRMFKGMVPDYFYDTDRKSVV